MKASHNVSTSRKGFTLIEMIGVLAVIAVLAGLLLPRIFAAVSQSQVNAAALGYNNIRSASMQYFGKYGKFAGVGGTNFASLPVTNYDTGVLLQEGLIEKPLGAPIGTNSIVAVVAAVSPATPATGSNSAFNLDGDSTLSPANDAGVGTIVIEVVYQSVTLDQARDLNRRIDGDSLGEGTTVGQDLNGRVKYDFGANQVGDVYMYIANK